jgi:hypothetical protein
VNAPHSGFGFIQSLVSQYSQNGLDAKPKWFKRKRSRYPRRYFFVSSVYFAKTMVVI